MDGGSPEQPQPRPTEAEVKNKLRTSLSEEKKGGTYRLQLAVIDHIRLGRAEVALAQVNRPKTGEFGQQVQPTAADVSKAQAEVTFARTKIDGRKVDSPDYVLAAGKVEAFNSSLAGVYADQVLEAEEVPGRVVSALESVYKEVYPEGDSEGQKEVAA